MSTLIKIKFYWIYLRLGGLQATLGP